MKGCITRADRDRKNPAGDDFSHPHPTPHPLFPHANLVTSYGLSIIDAWFTTYTCVESKKGVGEGCVCVDEKGMFGGVSIMPLCLFGEFHFRCARRFSALFFLSLSAEVPRAKLFHFSSSPKFRSNFHWISTVHGVRLRSGLNGKTPGRCRPRWMRCALCRCRWFFMKLRITGPSKRAGTPPQWVKAAKYSIEWKKEKRAHINWVCFIQIYIRTCTIY